MSEFTKLTIPELTSVWVSPEGIEMTVIEVRSFPRAGIYILLRILSTDCIVLRTLKEFSTFVPKEGHHE